MIYPDSLEARLGFDTIREKLKSLCLSPSGAAWVDLMTFETDAKKIAALLKQTLELRLILEKAEPFPSQHFFDGREWLDRIALEGAYLEGEEFLQMAQAMDTVIECRSFLSKAGDLYPELQRLAQPVAITTQLPGRIHKSIDDRGGVRDGATPELGKIRKRLRDEESSLRRLADQLFRKAVENKWVPDGALPTIRDGRVVIPVVSEHKRRLKGFILDESASGQTVFIEPAEMLDANNEIRDLQHGEKREVIRVLKELTDEMRPQLPEVRQAFDFLGQIDFIRAKAKFALETGGELPVVESSPGLTWYNARHPLLFLSLKGKRDVVPSNIFLEPDSPMLLVSGPNAGGKSVCLKTVGLLQYMAQCGLLIPVSERSRLGVFSSIFLDIGDQQSIENDLSTYSSHLKNMAFFIEHADQRSLVLMDELGSGTDPNFGGAIAQAVLEALLKKQVWGVATTHYYNLKLFASSHERISNASMRFDDKNMVPLYVLDIGKPGSSFALEIAQKTGLPGNTIAEAERLVGKDLAGFERLVRSLEREKQELTERIRRMEKQEQALKQSLAKYQALSEDLESRKKEIIGKAREEASQLLKQTNREIEKTIRHIRENRAERKETLRVRKGLESLTQRVTQTSDQKERGSQPIAVGDWVRIAGQEGSGVVLSIKGKSASVGFGELKSLIDLSRLEKVDQPRKAAEPASRHSLGIDLREKQANFNSTLDVRGKRVEELGPVLSEFMDQAILLGHGEVRILHGKGEGVLRKVVRDNLKKFSQVVSVSDEHVDRGGDGITVVVLK